MSAISDNIQCDRGRFKFRNIDVYESVDRAVFLNILKANRPAILRKCNFGDCFTLWNLDYLTENLAQEQIIIHQSDSSELSFISKNFKYQSCTFSEFSNTLADSKSTASVYLRSTNKNPRAKKAARIEDDFPVLAKDLTPPEFIPFGSGDKLYHSSVLRLASSNVQIWTHFDLYDNVLCQVVGTKRIILIPPEDTRFLYMKGDKSLVNEFDDWETCIKLYPLIERAELYKTILCPGDTLYIPALWWHNIRTIEKKDECKTKYSIGFNIFWRDESLESSLFYAENDVYGNKNPTPFDAALSNLDKAISHIEKLPCKFSMFYKYMLLERLKIKLNPVTQNDD